MSVAAVLRQESPRFPRVAGVASTPAFPLEVSPRSQPPELCVGPRLRPASRVCRGPPPPPSAWWAGHLDTGPGTLGDRICASGCPGEGHGEDGTEDGAVALSWQRHCALQTHLPSVRGVPPEAETGRQHGRRDGHRTLVEPAREGRGRLRSGEQRLITAGLGLPTRRLPGPCSGRWDGQGGSDRYGQAVPTLESTPVRSPGHWAGDRNPAWRSMEPSTPQGLVCCGGIRRGRSPSPALK